MHFQFNFTKSLQAAAVLLEYERARRMNSMRLLKLLYIADRESLADTGKTITGDHALAMERGPVLSRVYDLIRGQNSKAGDWDRFIHTDRFEVELVGEPGRGQLSRYEIEKLKELSDRYRDFDEWAMSEHTHSHFEEWAKFYAEGKSSPIPWEEVLAAAGRAEILEDAKRDENARQFFDSVFGGQS